MYEIKKIKSSSLAKVGAIFYGIIGFLVSLGVAISAMANIIMQKDFAGSVIIVTLFNLGAGILLGLIVAVITGFFGWIIGYVTGVIYNWFAKRFGGVKLELRKVEPERKEEEVKEE